MQNVICAICKNNKNTKVLYKENFNFSKINNKTFSARRIPDRTHYRFVKCLKCGLVFSDPIFPASKIEKFYKGSDFNYRKESEYLRKVYYRYFQHMNIINKKIQILEIGCGNGFFLDELYKHGYKNVYGIEPGRKSVSKAPESIKKNIEVNIFNANLFRNKKFDLILCFHTLDHLINLNEFIENVNELLKKNGKIFFIVHNTNGLSVKLLGEKSPIFDIEHIYLFNEKSLKRFFEKNGFKNTKVFNIVNKYPLSYWVRLFPFSFFVKEFILRFISLTRIGNLSISLSAGNIGIFAGKKI